MLNLPTGRRFPVGRWGSWWVHRMVTRLSRRPIRMVQGLCASGGRGTEAGSATVGGLHSRTRVGAEWPCIRTTCGEDSVIASILYYCSGTGRHTDAPGYGSSGSSGTAPWSARRVPPSCSSPCWRARAAIGVSRGDGCMLPARVQPAPGAADLLPGGRPRHGGEAVPGPILAPPSRSSQSLTRLPSSRSTSIATAPSPRRHGPTRCPSARSRTCSARPRAGWRDAPPCERTGVPGHRCDPRQQL